MNLSAGRHLTEDERFFNEQCVFKAGYLYVFPEEIEARSILDLAVASVTIKFREAIFLYGCEHRSTLGKVLGRDYLFMPNSGRQIAVVSLVFGQLNELPRRVKFFKVKRWLERIRLMLAKRQIGGTLHYGRVYEWPETIVAFTATRHLAKGPRGKMVFRPRQVKFKRGVFLHYLLDSDRCLFEVEVFADNEEKTVIRQDKVAIQITKDNIPKRIR